MFKKVILIFLTFLVSCNSAFSFSNCQVKYDSHPRALALFKGMCNVCHLNVNGSGPQNEFGRAFANAGFKITDDLITKFPEFFQKPKEETPPANISSSSSAGGPVTPVIQRIKPKKVKVNVPSMIQIMGQNFVNGAIAFIDNNEVITTFKSKTRLLIDFTLNSIGLHDVKVKNPDGQESNTSMIKAK